MIFKQRLIIFCFVLILFFIHLISVGKSIGTRILELSEGCDTGAPNDPECWGDQQGDADCGCHSTLGGCCAIFAGGAWDYVCMVGKAGILQGLSGYDRYKQGACPAWDEGDTCAILYDAGGTVKRVSPPGACSFWDTDSDSVGSSCITCYRKTEDRIWGTTETFYTDGVGIAGDGQCEAACGADPQCDEVMPGTNNCDEDCNYGGTVTTTIPSVDGPTWNKNPNVDNYNGVDVYYTNTSKPYQDFDWQLAWYVWTDIPNIYREGRGSGIWHADGTLTLQAYFDQNDPSWWSVASMVANSRQYTSDAPWGSYPGLTRLRVGDFPDTFIRAKYKIDNLYGTAAWTNGIIEYWFEVPSTYDGVTRTRIILVDLYWYGNSPVGYPGTEGVFGENEILTLHNYAPDFNNYHENWRYFPTDWTLKDMTQRAQGFGSEYGYCFNWRDAELVMIDWNAEIVPWTEAGSADMQITLDYFEVKIQPTPTTTTTTTTPTTTTIISGGAGTCSGTANCYSEEINDEGSCEACGCSWVSASCERDSGYYCCGEVGRSCAVYAELFQSSCGNFDDLKYCSGYCCGPITNPYTCDNKDHCHWEEGYCRGSSSISCSSHGGQYSCEGCGCDWVTCKAVGEPCTSSSECCSGRCYSTWYGKECQPRRSGGGGCLPWECAIEKMGIVIQYNPIPFYVISALVIIIIIFSVFKFGMKRM